MTHVPLHSVPDAQELPPPLEAFPEPALLVSPEPPTLLVFPEPPALVVFPEPPLLELSPEPPLTPVLPASEPEPVAGDENEPHEAIAAPSDTTMDSGSRGRIFFIFRYLQLQRSLDKAAALDAVYRVRTAADRAEENAKRLAPVKTALQTRG